MSDNAPNIPARPILTTEMEKVVSLREFEQRMFAIERSINEQIRAQATLVSARSDALDTALDLQAREYERRLGELNHAHQNAMENWRTSLPRELFNSFESEWQKWREAVSAQLVLLTQLPTSQKGLEDRMKAVEVLLQQIMGALVLIRFMGFAGVIALVVTFLRMAKLMP